MFLKGLLVVTEYNYVTELHFLIKNNMFCKFNKIY